MGISYPRSGSIRLPIYPPTLLKTYAVIRVLKERSGKIINVLVDYLL